MKSSTLLPGFAFGALLLAGCDQTTASTSSVAMVTIAPRLLASNLHSSRVKVVFQHGTGFISSDSTTFDSAYSSGKVMALGQIPVGDSFAITLEGYDVVSGSNAISWFASVRGLAVGSDTRIQGVSIPVNTTAQAALDSSGNSLSLPAGTYYTIDGTDPRGTGSLYAQAATSVPKTGIIKAVVLSPAGTSGVSVWSQVRTLTYATTTGPTDLNDPAIMSTLSGDWWQSSSSTSNNITVPLLIHIHLVSNGSLQVVSYLTDADSTTSNVFTGWEAGSSKCQLTSATSSETETYTYNASSGILSFQDNTFWTRNRPVLIDPSLVKKWTSSTNTSVWTNLASDGTYSLSTRTSDRYTWSTGKNATSGTTYLFLYKNASLGAYYSYTIASGELVLTDPTTGLLYGTYQ